VRDLFRAFQPKRVIVPSFPLRYPAEASADFAAKAVLRLAEKKLSFGPASGEKTSADN
jgi:hypothetical protein